MTVLPPFIYSIFLPLQHHQLTYTTSASLRMWHTGNLYKDLGKHFETFHCIINLLIHPKAHTTSIHQFTKVLELFTQRKQITATLKISLNSLWSTITQQTYYIKNFSTFLDTLNYITAIAWDYIPHNRHHHYTYFELSISQQQQLSKLRHQQIMNFWNVSLWVDTKLESIFIKTYIVEFHLLHSNFHLQTFQDHHLL